MLCQERLEELKALSVAEPIPSKKSVLLLAATLLSPVEAIYPLPCTEDDVEHIP